MTRDRPLSAREQKTDPFSSWVAKYRFRLLKVAQRYASASMDAEDIVQEALLLAFSKRRDLRDERAMGRWLATITSNLGKQIQRAKVRRQGIESARRAGTGEADECCGVSPTLHEELLRLSLWKAVDDLPPEQRTAVIQWIRKDMSLRESALAMGKTIGAVKSCRHRALTTLRRRFFR